MRCATVGDEFELVFPFSVCASQGGPFDDDAFVAGVQFGTAMERMVAGFVPATFTVDERLEALLDLVAMREGCVTEVTEREGGWIVVGVTPVVVG